MKRRIRHTVTHEQSVLASLQDIAQALLGDRFESGSNVQYELQVRTGQGAGKVDPNAEFLVVQFVREERDPIEPAPPPATEQTP